MQRSIFPFIAALLIPISPAIAQESTSATAPVAKQEAAVDQHQRLVDALNPKGLSDQEFAKIVSQASQALETDPGTKEIEDYCPGYIDTLTEAMTPSLLEFNKLEAAYMSKKLLDLFRRELTAKQAQNAAYFYNSDLGQKLLFTTVENITFENTIDDQMARPIEEDSNSLDKNMFEKDTQNSAKNAVAAMTPEDNQAIESAYLEGDWFPALQRILPEMSKIRFEAANFDYDPSLDAKMEQEVNTAVTAHLATCETSQ